MKKEINWKVKYGIIFLLASIIIYLITAFIFHDEEEIISYILMHLGFIPIDILIVVFVIEGTIDKKEKEAVYEKLDMIMGTFFAEIGDEILERFTKVDKNKIDYNDLKSINSWDDKKYEKVLKHLKNQPATFNPELSKEEQIEFLIQLKSFLHEKRGFLINLLDNPNLLEKDQFSKLLLALFHLSEELEHRKDLNQTTEIDFNHLVGDMNRVYSHLMYEWINYLQYLNKYYPYMISIAIRTNPFDTNADIHVKE